MSQGLMQEPPKLLQISHIKDVYPIFTMHKSKELTKKELSVLFRKNICT